MLGANYDMEENTIGYDLLKPSDMKKENEYIYILFKRICEIYQVKSLFENDDYNNLKLINVTTDNKIEAKFDYDEDNTLTSKDGYITWRTK